jgi:hypothetical protein
MLGVRRRRRRVRRSSRRSGDLVFAGRRAGPPGRDPAEASAGKKPTGRNLAPGTLNPGSSLQPGIPGSCGRGGETGEEGRRGELPRCPARRCSTGYHWCVLPRACSRGLLALCPSSISGLLAPGLCSPFPSSGLLFPRPPLSSPRSSRPCPLPRQVHQPGQDRYQRREQRRAARWRLCEPAPRPLCVCHPTGHQPPRCIVQQGSASRLQTSSTRSGPGIIAGSVLGSVLPRGCAS